MNKKPRNYEFKTMLDDLPSITQVETIGSIAYRLLRRRILNRFTRTPRAFSQSEDPIAPRLIIIGADSVSKGIPIPPYLALIGVLIYLSLLIVNAYTLGALGLPSLLAASLAVGLGVSVTAIYVAFANWLAARRLSKLISEM